MEVHKARFLKDFLGKNRRTFEIPSYQRNYSWDHKNCETLFEDIIKAGENNKTHFLGTILYKSYSNSSSIDRCLMIDGQQRLTSTIIFLKVIENDLKGKEEYASKLSIIKEYLYNSNCEEDYKVKLKSIRQDNEQITKIFQNKFDELDKQSNVVINYYKFEKLLNDYLRHDGNIETIYNGLEKLGIAEIILEESDDPQLIFESINSTGKSLTITDQIRNFLLMGMSIDEQNELYDDFWIKLEENLTMKYFEDFIFDYLVMKNSKYLKENELYNEFKLLSEKQFSNNKKDILEELLKYSKYYVSFIKELNCSYPSEISERTQLFQVLSHNTVYPFLMLVFDDYENHIIDKNKLTDILDFMNNYALRRLVIGIPSSSLRRFYSDLYQKIFKKADNKEKYLESIITYFCKFLKTNDKMPINEEFRTGLIGTPIYNKGALTKFLLDKIENTNNREVVDFEELTIEHIMPQTLNKEWKEMLGDNFEVIHSKYLHTLGNLSITGYNTEYSNEPFNKKKSLMDEYRTRILVLNEEIFANDIWAEDQIITRANRLSNIVMDIYKYPSSNLIDSDIEFEEYEYINIDECVGNMDGLKLVGFSYNNEKYEINRFNWLLIETTKLLYNINKGIIQNLAREEDTISIRKKPYISTNDEKFNSPKEIDEGVYIETNYSSDWVIYTIKRLLSKYNIDFDNFKVIFKNES